MAFVDAQGFESVSNKSDLSLQGFVDTFGWNMFSKASGRIAGSRSLAFESSLQAANDVSPNFAGTGTVQKNTGKLISDLWTAGGFAFGARGKFRELGNTYFIGDVLVNNTAVVNQQVAGRIVWDGTYYWSIRKNTTLPNSGFEVVQSTDLINWAPPAAIPQPQTAGKLPANVSLANGRVIVGFTDNNFAYTTNGGTSWTAGTLFGGSASNGQFPMFTYVPSTGYYYSHGTNDPTNQNNSVVVKSLDMVTWTTVTTFSFGVAGNLHVSMFHDTVRQRIFFTLTSNSGSGGNGSRLSSIDYTDAVTVNWNLTGGQALRFGPNSVAFDGTATGTIVLTTTTGTVYYATGANPTTWTQATTTNLPTFTDTAKNTVVYDPRSSQWVITSGNGYIAVSLDGINWTITQQITTSRYNVGATYINGRVICTGQSIMIGSGLAGTTNYGWDVRYFTQNLIATNASSSNNVASRLGVAAVNSSGRQGYVGLGYQGDLTSGSGATLRYLPGNAATDSATYPTSVIPYLNNGSPWHYYVLIFTATATANQFTVQAVVDGSVVAGFSSTVQLAPTSDTTSTLYWTVPVRDSTSSAVLPSMIEFDDIYVFDNSGTVNNTALLDCVILPEQLVSDAQAQWTRSPAGAASNAVAARSVGISAAAGQVSTTTNGAVDIYNSDQTLDISAYSVKAVIAEAVLSNTALATSVAKVGMQSGSASVDTGNVTIATGAQVFARKVQETDPNTGSAWARTAAKAATVTLAKVS